MNFFVLVVEFSKQLSIFQLSTEKTLTLQIYKPIIMFKKTYIILLFIFFPVSPLPAQNPELAKKYLEQGDLDKAAYEYKLLVDKFSYNDNYLFNLIKIYQSQSKFNAVNELLKKRKSKQKPQYLVYWGYNYQLQKDTVTARKFYLKAIKAVKKTPYRAYAVGQAFKQLYLLDEALQTYQTAIAQGNNPAYLMQIAQIYAEKNDIPNMIKSFLDLLEKEPKYESQVKYYLTRSITQDPESEANTLLKKQLIERIKATHTPRWYRLLQWLYTQQKEYKKAFLQLKSLYRKNLADISEIFHLARTAVYNKKTDDAKAIYGFLATQTAEPAYAEMAKLELIKLDLKEILNPEQKQEIVQKFETYLQENWSPKNQIDLKIAYADFLAFHLNQPGKALEILSGLERKTFSKKQQAAIKLKKADILLLQENFNQALILYTQVQLDFPNDPTGHKATFDLARASFFQGDIDWAHTQLKVIKSVADDLIANDAIDMDLTIINNKEEGDTLYTGLKKLARAKFEIFRKKPQTALKILDTIARNFKGQLVYDDALMLAGKLLEQSGQYQAALEKYQAVLDNRTEDLLKDDALFRMAMIYEQTGDDEKAKKLFKKIILEYPGGFWYVDARKHYRRLRGDNLDDNNL